MRWSVWSQDVCDSGIEEEEVARFEDRNDAVVYVRTRNMTPSARLIYYVKDGGLRAH